MQGDAELKMKMNTCTNMRLRQTGTHLPEKEKRRGVVEPSGEDNPGKNSDLSGTRTASDSSSSIVQLPTHNVDRGIVQKLHFVLYGGSNKHLANSF